MIYSQNAQIVCHVDFEQDFYKFLQVENLCFTYLQQWFITHFSRSNFIAMQPPEIVSQCSCSVNTQKTNLRQIFLQRTTPRTCTYKKFKENNLAKVISLKLLTKENLFECFHQFATYQKRRRILVHPNFVEKSTCKQSGFFDHQNYLEKSKQKHRGYFDQRNYIVKSTWKRGFFDQRNYTRKSRWKQRGFFDHRNYLEKGRQNY